MAHPPEKRMELRAAYIGGLPLEAAADKVGIPLGTARNWFRTARDGGDDWDRFRAASLIVAGGGIDQAMGRIIAAGLMRAEAVLEQFEKVEDPAAQVAALAVLGDTISKLKAAGKTLMVDTNKLGVAMDVLRRLNAYITENKPELTGAFAELLPEFGKEVAREYG